MDASEIDKKKAAYEGKTTSSIIKDGQLNDTVEIPYDLNLRFKLEYATCTDFDTIAKKILMMLQMIIDISMWYVVCQKCK